MNPYANRAQLGQLGVGSEALAKVPTPAQDEALESASRLIDGFLAPAGYTVPVTPTSNAGGQVVRAVCIVAAYDLMVVRGYQSSQEGDDQLRKRYEDIILTWGPAVANGDIDPGVIVEDEGDLTTGEVAIASDEPRGW